MTAMNEDPINPPGFPPKRKTISLAAIKKLQEENTDPNYPLSDGVKLMIKGIDRNSPPEQQEAAELFRMLDINGQKLNHVLQIVEKLDKERIEALSVRHAWNQTKAPERLGKLELNQSWSAPAALGGLIISISTALFLWLGGGK